MVAKEFTITPVQAYTPASGGTSGGGDTPKADDGEDPNTQSVNCRKIADVGTTDCTFIDRVEETDVIVEVVIPKPIHPGRLRRFRARISRVLLAFKEGAKPPPMNPVAADATEIRLRGGKAPLHRSVRYRLRDPKAKFIRVWTLTLGREGERVFGTTSYLFEVRGNQAFRLVEGKKRKRAEVHLEHSVSGADSGE